MRFRTCVTNIDRVVQQLISDVNQRTVKKQQLQNNIVKIIHSKTCHQDVNGNFKTIFKNYDQFTSIEQMDKEPNKLTKENFSPLKVKVQNNANSTFRFRKNSTIKKSRRFTVSSQSQEQLCFNRLKSQSLASRQDQTKKQLFLKSAIKIKKRDLIKLYEDQDVEVSKDQKTKVSQQQKIQDQMRLNIIALEQQKQLRKQLQTFNSSRVQKLRSKLIANEYEGKIANYDYEGNILNLNQKEFKSTNMISNQQKQLKKSKQTLNINLQMKKGSHFRSVITQPIQNEGNTTLPYQTFYRLKQTQKNIDQSISKNQQLDIQNLCNSKYSKRQASQVKIFKNSNYSKNLNNLRKKSIQLSNLQTIQKEYSNNNNRQVSTIPYLEISQGVKYQEWIRTQNLSQQSVNNTELKRLVTVEKQKTYSYNKNSGRSIRSNACQTFRSYLPFSQNNKVSLTLMNKTISVFSTIQKPKKQSKKQQNIAQRQKTQQPKLSKNQLNYQFIDLKFRQNGYSQNIKPQSTIFGENIQMNAKQITFQQFNDQKDLRPKTTKQTTKIENKRYLYDQQESYRNKRGYIVDLKKNYIQKQKQRIMTSNTQRKTNKNKKYIY